ncbi:MAG TPA: hypothetical protein VMD29_14410 [Terracidiphilus sp.]|nr:hypothetical protein [Terracidiphilus sp.]
MPVAPSQEEKVYGVPILDPHLALIDMLRRTPRHLEANKYLAREDPALADLKRTIVMMIVEHEFRDREHRPKAA